MHPFRKGVNVTGIHAETRFDYPLCKERAVEKKDFERIAGMGFDHVRLLADHGSLMTAGNGFELILKEEGWQRLDEVLDWIKDCGLRVIICLRCAPGYCYRDAENVRDGANTLFFVWEQRQQFLKLWLEFEKRYAGTEDRIAFELLDRVGFKLKFNNILQTGCGWTALAAMVWKGIRELSASRKIIIGTETFGSSDGLADIPWFPGDENIIYAFQFFKPELFTKQAAYNHRVISDYSALNHWVKTEIIRYPGIIPGLDLFLDKHPEYEAEMKHYRNTAITDELIESVDFASVYEFQKNHPEAELYASSFAPVMYADPDSRKNWLKCAVKLFEKAGIGYCYYKYMGSRWGIVNMLQEEDDDETALDVLFGKRGTNE